MPGNAERASPEGRPGIATMTPLPDEDTSVTTIQPGAADLGPVLLAAIDPAAEWRYRRALCREAYDRGHAEGWETGRRALLEELAEAQRIACGPAAAALASPERAELERRRYGPGGREHFGDHRQDDYRGGPVAWERQAGRAA